MTRYGTLKFARQENMSAERGAYYGYYTSTDLNC